MLSSFTAHKSNPTQNGFLVVQEYSYVPVVFPKPAKLAFLRKGT
jgi:hypothetical protein